MRKVFEKLWMLGCGSPLYCQKYHNAEKKDAEKVTFSNSLVISVTFNSPV